MGIEYILPVSHLFPPAVTTFSATAFCMPSFVFPILGEWGGSSRRQAGKSRWFLHVLELVSPCASPPVSGSEPQQIDTCVNVKVF